MPETQHASKLGAVRVWLVTLWALVLLMSMIGAATRLTGSGLSIVEWRPVTGALPPLNAGEWQEAFAAYQSSPQFQKINHWMSLSDFKRIFLWEYVHRLFGRMLGFAFLLPFVYFAATRVLRGARMWRAGSVFVLGGLQGGVGWFMVQSGLVNEPRVSHLRLALHLTLAFGIGQWVLWQLLELGERPSAARPRRSDRWLAFGLLPVLGLQIVYGAFVAGTHAGLLFPTFPDMNGHYAPGPFVRSGASLLADLVTNPLLIHYVHRALALLLVVQVAVLAWRLRKSPGLRLPLGALLLAVSLQIVLGALTVLTHVSITWAVAHQAGAYLTLSAAVMLCHAMFVASEARDDAEARDRDGGVAGARQDLRRT